MCQSGCGSGGSGAMCLLALLADTAASGGRGAMCLLALLADTATSGGSGAKFSMYSHSHNNVSTFIF